MARDSVKRKAAGPGSAPESVSAAADGAGTSIVQSGEQIREIEAQYRSIFEATTDGLGVLDMDGYIVEVNPAYCQMYGYDRDEVIGLHALALMPPDYHHLLADGMQSIVSGNPVRFRSAGLRKDGTSFPVDGRGTTFLFNGKPHILGVSRDVTEQVRAEEQLKEREAQYRSIFESSVDGLGIYDQKGFLVEANPALCRMLGYSRDELVGLHAGATVHPDYHHVISEGLERVNRDEPFRREIALLRKDGTAVRARYEIHVSPPLCDEPDLTLPVKEALYRIAQEAVHNAVKHARPRSVAVSLEQEEQAVLLEIRDDGQGFDTGGSFPGHLGLHSMRERAQRAGGTLEVESRIGEGTRVRVRVPTPSDR